MMFLSCNLRNVNPLKCVSVNNQECKVRAKIVDVNSYKPVHFPYRIKTNKCSRSCNNTMSHLQNYVFLML